MGKQDKRIRNTAKELYSKILEEIINPRLDGIEKYVKEAMAKMQSQQQNVHGFILGEVKFTIANELEDSKVTRLALIEVLQDVLGIEGLIAKLDEKKGSVKKHLIAEAEATIKKRQEDARTAEAANAQPTAEVEAPQQEGVL